MTEGGGWRVGHLARAKVNLTLSVTDRRPDGFHELRSVFARIGLADRVRVARLAAPGDRLGVDGDPDCPVDGNLVLEAIGAVRAHEGSIPHGERPLPWLDIELHKRIPVGAGLGGGSADAAAALDALGRTARDVALSRDPQLPARLGADLPFFLSGAPIALVTGVGEHVEPLPPVQGSFGLLLVTPSMRLSTAAVFAAWDELGGPTGADRSDGLASDLRSGLGGAGLAGWSDRLRDANDLWPAAASIAPELPRLRVALESDVRRPFLLTGSGSTLFAIYPSVDEAAAAGRALVASRPPYLSGARLAAVDDTGPDPAWRTP